MPPSQPDPPDRPRRSAPPPDRPAPIRCTPFSGPLSASLDQVPDRTPVGAPHPRSVRSQHHRSRPSQPEPAYARVYAHDVPAHGSSPRRDRRPDQDHPRRSPPRSAHRSAFLLTGALPDIYACRNPLAGIYARSAQTSAHRSTSTLTGASRFGHTHAHHATATTYQDRHDFKSILPGHPRCRAARPSCAERVETPI